MALANRIAVVRDGKLEQEGSAHDIYEHPVNQFVARFIGEANEFAAQRQNGRVDISGGPEFDESGPDGLVQVVVRPEKLLVGQAALVCEVQLEGQVEDIVYLGTHKRIRMRLSSGVTAFSHRPGDEEIHMTIGQNTNMGWQLADQRILSDE